MSKNMTGILIETTVRNAIRQIKDDPERNIRNIVDMALNFSNGRFQKHFLLAAQNILKNENSSYYKLIPDLINNVDEERLITFGMNVGYNSCTIGAKKIREIETSDLYNVPWTVSLEINGDQYISLPYAYHSLIEQGKKLGIYTWSLYSLGQLTYILELADAFPECAFPIFCSAEEITPDVLDDASHINNIMFVIRHSDHIDDVCKLLRSKKILYSISYSYSENELSDLDIDSILCDTGSLHSIFTIFIEKNNCFTETTHNVYQSILQTRLTQKYHSIPFDMIQDNLFIDSIISDQACSICFTKDGFCYSYNNRILHQKYNLFDYSLPDILKAVSPKKEY